MDKLLKGIERAAYIVGYATGYILLGIIALTQIEVITRYLLRQPLILCDEFGGYSLFALTFLGLAYCAKEKGHIRITFLSGENVGESIRPGPDLHPDSGLDLHRHCQRGELGFLDPLHSTRHEVESWLMTPLYWPQMVLPIGCTLFFLVLLVQLVRTIRDVKAGARVEEASGQEF